MRHSLVNLDGKNRDLIAYSNFSDLSTNKGDIDKMKQILRSAMINELTIRQRECITMYYYEKKKMKTIAKELSLSVPTVSKHIKVAEQKLKNIANYY